VRDCVGGARVVVRAAAVVNAAGPWSDQVRRLEDPAAAAGVRGTKGVHILVPRERIRNRGALTLIAPRDGRVVFVLPAGPHTVVGTTDTPTDAAPDEVRATRGDVEYLLDVANTYFPWSQLTEGDVISAWAGIRPLAAAGSAKDPAASSREHTLHESPAGLLSITGGKLTTYRSMAAEVVDAVERRLGRGPAPSRTAELQLPNAVPSLESETRLATSVVRDEIVAQHLVESYGTAWRAVWALARRDAWLAGHVVSHLPVLRAELAYAVARELALTIADLLMRRTKLAFQTRGPALETAIADGAAVLTSALGWSAEEREAAIEEYRREHARVFAIDG
jgi:glycerol-3-phosphate dehydrogenase